jgi:UDP-N-acetylglucosamine--N-acetylmuramyl-(pentapeptide) pyrophosphoryl-undecaprenol N-acetylglucosamine transferase
MAPGPRQLSVVIAGGGTGGHLYPGIAVAREWRRQLPDVRVSFAGTARGLEARIVPREGFELDVIRSAGLKGKSLMARAQGVLLLVPSMLDAWRVISKRRPDIVLGVGGYSSGPVVLLAAMRGIPTMVLEQNAVPGLTNRSLARVVRAAAVTYDETRTYFGSKGFVAGNPVRAEFFATPDPAGGPGGREALRVLIVGGSQGARGLNALVTEAAPSLAMHIPGLEIVHQTGERDLDAARDTYVRVGLSARVAAFLDPVAPDMHAADLVICRAGATTLAELAAAGRPAVLVPLPTATDDHQRKNALALVRAGAAVMVDQGPGAADTLARTVTELLGNRDRLSQMARAMRALARPEAAADIVTRARELVR